MDMYTTLSQTIQSGQYDLTSMTAKIDTLYAADRLTEEERTELISLCIQHLDPASKLPNDVMVLIQYLAKRIDAHEERIKALEGADPDDTTATVGYPDWEQPYAGLTDNYQYGAIVAHVGKLWQSRYNGQNVWEPGTLGTESIWVEYTATSTD